MTTSWAWLVRGDVWQALAANVGGVLLAIMTAATASWLLASAVRGRWLGGLPSDRTLVGLAIAVVMVTLVDWLVRVSVG